MRVIRSVGAALGNNITLSTFVKPVKNVEVVEYSAALIFNKPATTKIGLLNAVVPAGGSTLLGIMGAGKYPVFKSLKFSAVAAGLYYLRYNAAQICIMNLQANVFYDISLNELFIATPAQNIDIFNPGGAGVQCYGTLIYSEVPT